MDRKENKVIPLSDLLKNYTEEYVSSMLHDYKTVFDSDTESFLQKKAIDMEKKDLSRTYIAISDGKVIGYVTLGLKCMRIPEEEQDMIDDDIVDMMNVENKTKIAQSYLLGQLSRSSDAPKGFGKLLIAVAFNKLYIAKQIVGCRTLRLDCHDELIPYYEGLGFRLIRKSQSGTLNQMVTFF